MSDNSISKGIIFTGLFALLLTPFFISSSFLFPFITGKAYFFRVVVEIIFVAWIFLALNNREYRPKKSWLMIIFSLFVASLAVSTMLSPNPFKSFWSNFERMDGYITLLHLFLLFIVMGSVFKDAKNWRGWWKASIFTSAIMCVYCFFQLAGKLQINQGGVRVDGTLGNAAYLATYLLFSFFITLFIFAHEKKLWAKVMYGVVGLAQLYVLYSTATRGALLGLFGGLILMALILAFKGEGKIKKAGIGTIVGLVVLAGGFLAIKNTNFVKESPVLSRLSSVSFSEFKTQGRYFVWPMALQGIGDKPVFGWGIESFNYVFNKYYDPRMYNHEPWFDRAHSAPLDWLIAGGIIGGGLYILLCLLALWKAFRDREENEEFKGESSAILTGLLAAYLFQSLFLFDNTVSYIYFVAFLAYLHSRSNSSWMKLENINFGNGSKRLIPAIFCVLLVFSLYFGIWKPMKAGTQIIEGLKSSQQNRIGEATQWFKSSIDLNTLGTGEAREQLAAMSGAASQSQDAQVRANYLSVLNDEMGKQIAMAPDDGRNRIIYAVSLSQMGRHVEALAQLKAAEKLMPKKQMVYMQEGQVYVAQGDYQNAIASMKIAYDLEKSNPDALVSLAVMYLYAGLDNQALELFNSVNNQDSLLFNDRLLGALVDLKRFSEAVNILNSRISKVPDDINNYVSLAALYLQIGQSQNAIQVLTTIGNLRPDYKQTADAYIQQIREGKNPAQQN